MRKIIVVLLPIALILASFVISDNKENEVKWMTFEEAMIANKTTPKPYFVDVYTDWCGWCKKMDETTFKNKKVKAVLNKYFHNVKFNAEQKEDVIIGSDTLRFDATNGRRGVHALATSLLNGRMSYPTYVFLNEKMEVIQPLPGYRTAAEFEPMLEFFGSGKYQSMSWEEFKQERSTEK